MAALALLVAALCTLAVIFGLPHGSRRPPPKTTKVPGSLSQWRLVFSDDFTNLAGVHAEHSSPALNASLGPYDSSNAQLQKPEVPGNVKVVRDPQAQGGHALEVETTWGAYPVPGGIAHGWVNGRMELIGHEERPPFLLRVRVRFTPSVQTKSAIMWWPASVPRSPALRSQHWEVDLAETFGGPPGTAWARRQQVEENWHRTDFGIPRPPAPLSFRQQGLDAARYHVYSLYVTRREMWEAIDGRLVAVGGPPWLPSGEGLFAVGKALTGARDDRHTPDAAFVNWVKLYKPRTSHIEAPPLH